eukprot:276642-Pleurochrysis_carterae.AAC.1
MLMLSLSKDVAVGPAAQLPVDLLLLPSQIGPICDGVHRCFCGSCCGCGCLSGAYLVLVLGLLLLVVMVMMVMVMVMMVMVMMVMVMVVMVMVVMVMVVMM